MTGGLFACPACEGSLAEAPGELSCEACGASYRSVGGAWDFAPELDGTPNLSARFMQSRRIVRIYERAFRPALTRAVGGPSYAREEAFLRRWFEPVGGLVLDIACGTGRYTRMLRQASGQPTVGLDLSRPMLAHARARSWGCTFVRGSAQALPLRAGSVGAVNCFGALHLFPDPVAALAEMGRVLAPGGSLTCLTASDRDRRPLWQPAFSRLAAISFLPLEDVERGLQRGGLELLHHSRHGAMALFAARRA